MSGPGLLLGDVVALVAFGLVGLASHEHAVTAKTVARAILPFPLAWLAVAPWFGVIGRTWEGDGADRWGRLALAWLTAGVLALCARALVFDRELFNAFFVIALVGNGLFLAAWRAIYNRWLSGAPRPAAQRGPTLESR